MSEKIKWGVIGSGGIARRRTIPEGIVPSQNSELVSVYDVNTELNNAVAKEFQAAAANSFQDLIGADIDAVYVASPAYLHLEQVIACARNKKHVLCEKPLGLNTEEAERMGEVCRKEGVILGVGLMMGFLSQHQSALKLIQEGRLGRLVYGRAQLSCWYPPIPGAWRQDPKIGGGGSLMDMGSHCLDLLEMFFGRIRSVSCFINRNVHSYQSEDSAVVSVLFENGALGTVDTYFCIPDNSSKNALELYGSGGSIIARGTIGQDAAGEMTAYLEGDTSGYDAEQSRSIAAGLVIAPEPVNAYFAEIEEFSLSVLEQREPANSFARGLRSQKVLSACYQSAKTGKTVDIE